jgi:hypothetical protein
VDSNDLDENQLSWLQETLLSQGCRWRIAFGHHPVKSSGTHGDTGGDVETALRPALGRARADLYLAGHDHQFSDEGPFLANRESPSSPLIRQLVVGTGGAGIRHGACQGAHCRHFENSYGFLHLHWNQERMDFTFYRVNGSAAYTSGI